MGIRTKQFPSYGLTLDIWSEPLTDEEIIAHFAELTAADADRRISFMDPTVDLSTTGIMSIPELMRTVASKVKELYVGRPMRSAIVWGPEVNRSVVDFWLRYAWSGSERAAHAPLAFSSLEEACDWLELPAGAREAVAKAVQT